MPVGSRKGLIRANETQFKSPAHAIFRKRSKNLLWEQTIIDRNFWLWLYFRIVCAEVILSNTNSLSRYLQGKTVDVISARRNAAMTIQTLRQCWSETSFNSVWQIASAMGPKMEKWLTNSQFELREARAPRQTPSHHLQAFVGEHAQRQTQLTPESYHRINNLCVHRQGAVRAWAQVYRKWPGNTLCFGKYLPQWNTW